MTWQPRYDKDGIKQKYSIQKGKWVICHTIHGVYDKYTLWNGSKRIGSYDTAEEAKEEAHD